VPPMMPGESASCHVCGGTLDTNALIARCTYCGADNVTTPDVMAKRQAQEGAAAGDIDARVEREAGSVGATSGWLVLVTVAAFVVIPIFLFIMLAVILASFRSMKRPPKDSETYVAQKTSIGTCIGRVGEGTIYFGIGVPFEERRMPVPAGAKLFHARELVGKRVRPARLPSSPFVPVEEVSSCPLYSNMATITTPGVDDRIELTDLCIEPEPEP
jgi:hypothetical protein